MHDGTEVGSGLRETNPRADALECFQNLIPSTSRDVREYNLEHYKSARQKRQINQLTCFVAKVKLVLQPGQATETAKFENYFVDDLEQLCFSDV